MVVNGGAESEEPIIALRPEDAEDLGLSLNNFDVIEVELASEKTHNLTSRNVELLDEQGNVLFYTYAYLVIDENLNEPLITDATVDELGIAVVSFKKGLWRHINDPPNTTRYSAHGWWLDSRKLF